MSDPLHDDDLERFLRGLASPEDASRRMRRALLSGGDAEPWQPAPTAPADYAAALARVRATAPTLEAAAESAERRAAAAVAELQALPRDAWEGTVREQERFHSWAAVRELQRASLATLHDQPSRAAALARLAVTAAEALSLDSLPLDSPPLDSPPAGRRHDSEDSTAPWVAASAERLRADVRALAWGQRANAERVASDLLAAESAFRTALEQREQGTGDPAVAAELEGLLASLRSDQGRYGEALELAERAARRFRRLGDDHGYGRIRLKQATLHAYREELDRALATLDEALEHLDPASEPRLAFAARHNRASYLDRLGSHDAAAAELAAAATLAESALDRVRWTWLAGRIDAHRGRREVGEARLREARDEFLARGIGYDAALVGLELAAFYADQGRTADMRRLAEEMVPVFASRDVHQRAREALQIWYDAARAEAAGLHLVRSVMRYLERARHRPDLSFERG